ncbi:MAG TPA: hypothetical protein VFA68_18320 [Terriglobales bacterium]|nr:hypothetical protein [Terriglobales bacterium]
MIDLVRNLAVPANLMQAAAKGALSIPPAEMLEILVHLATKRDVLSDQARLTLAGWDERASLAAAADPNTPKEVLEYFAAPANLRPVLIPALLENPSVPEECVIELARSGSRETVELMLNSARVCQSLPILQVLSQNPNLRAAETETLEEYVQELSGKSEPDPDRVLPPAGEETGSEPDEVLDEVLSTYLNEYAAELSATPEKPFAAIGGVFDSIKTEPEEPLTEAAAGPLVHGSEAAKPAMAKKKHVHPDSEEKRGSTLQKIAKLDIKGRIQLAMKGTKEERSILIRDGTKLVALAVLESPKISDGEVEKIAAQKNVLEAVLRQIPLKRRFVKHYGIVRNLVANPRTPLDVSLALMKNLLAGDLRNLSSNKDVSETVRKLAFKMYRQKTDSQKKSSS